MRPARPPWQRLLRDPVHCLAFGFGAGCSPLAPGTAGSLLGLALFLMLPPLPWPWLLGLLAAVLAFGVWVCGASARRLGVHDHPGIVLDEIAGMWIVAASLPRQPGWLLAGFIAFRLFDIFKPWPIRDVDHSVRGGLGIMLDDVIAAVYAALLLAAGRQLLTAW
ncbi:MAG: phosphatidylglycerophosphatase A [Gammaproteobacteria bacterium]|nr:MAG: phosphatidylglycerophosphatase A [Gammaproteobacteria bacterium]